MKFTLLASALFTTLVVASPVAELDKRATARVQLSDNGRESGGQFDIPINNRITAILGGRGFVADTMSIVRTGNVVCQAYLQTNGSPVGRPARGPNGRSVVAGGATRNIKGVKCSRP